MMRFGNDEKLKFFEEYTTLFLFFLCDMTWSCEDRLRECHVDGFPPIAVCQVRLSGMSPQPAEPKAPNSTNNSCPLHPVAHSFLSSFPLSLSSSPFLPRPRPVATSSCPSPPKSLVLVSIFPPFPALLSCYYPFRIISITEPLYPRFDLLTSSSTTYHPPVFLHLNHFPNSPPPLTPAPSPSIAITAFTNKIGTITFPQPASSMWGGSSTSRDPASASSAPTLEIKVRDLDAERRDRPPTSSAPLSMGWLLRLFRSDFFDAFMAVTYLYRYRDSRGVYDYLCNQLYALADADLEAFMPQVCNLLVQHARDSPALERFVMDKCADSMHIALQVFWFLQAAVEDAARMPDRQAEQRCRLLRTRCETAALNGSQHVMLAAAAHHITAATLVAVEAPFSNRKKQVSSGSLFPSSSAGNLTANEHKSPSQRHRLSPRSRADRIRILPTDDVRLDSPGSGSARASAKSPTYTPEKPRDVDSAERAEDNFVIAPKIPRDEALTESESIERVGIPKKPCDDVDQIGSALQDISLDNDVSVDQVTQPLESLSASTKTVAQNTDEEVVKQKSPIAGAGAEDEIPKSNKPQEKSDPPNLGLCGDQAEQESSAINEEDLGNDFDPLALLTMKKERFDYFNDSLSIAKAFVRLSLTARDVQQDQRRVHLVKGLDIINDMLLRRMKGEPSEPLVGGSETPTAAEIGELGETAALRSIHLPLTRASSHVLRILRVHSDEVVVLTSRTRVPYMVNIEVLPTKMLCSDKLVFCEQRLGVSESSKSSSSKPPTPKRSPNASPSKRSPSKESEPDSTEDKDKVNKSQDTKAPRSRRRLSEMTPVELQKANVRNVVYGDAYSDQPYVFKAAEEMAAEEENKEETVEKKARQAVILGVYGELWSWKEERILSKSPFKDVKRTRLMPFIVKAGDDLRQEQLAIQLISQFKNIFDEEGVEVYLKPFTVMSVSSEAGFVEVITDAVSVHSLKKRTPNFVSLLDYFERAFGEVGTSSFRAAQRRFIRSMAGYSLVTYFLQIKDRHNGNIMLDAQGRIIHIDFGFMLTNSPGAIKFENVPFKLTEEYLQVICGMKNVQDLAEASKTEGYRYFQEQFVLGLLAARKHYEKITTLVEIMTDGTTMPCMTGGHSIVEALRARFAVGMPEEQCINFGLGLIEESRLSWRSAGYDRFQAYSNGYR